MPYQRTNLQGFYTLIMNTDYSKKLLDPRWQKKRLEILNRDEFSCQHCGSTRNTLNVHHIGYFNNPWDVPNKLLITLCNGCHELEEINIKPFYKTLVNDLRRKGFGSMLLSDLPDVFSTDRGWYDYAPATDILKMIIEDDKIWLDMQALYFERAKQGVIKGNNSYGDF